MFCTNCGNKINENAVFCPQCGKKVGESTSAPKQTPKTKQPVEKTVQHQAVPAAGGTVTTGKSHKKMLIVAVAIFIFVVIFILAVSLIGNSGSKGKRGNSSKSASVFKSDDDEKSAGFANGIYKPDGDEHRFEEIMEEMQANKQITISNSETGAILVALDENIKSTVFIGGGYLPKLKTDEEVWDSEKFFTSYCILCMDPEASDDRTLKVYIDPDHKTYTYLVIGSGSNDSEYLNGYTGKVRTSGYEGEEFGKVPDILTPDKWTFLESTTEKIGDSEYYCEKYSVTIDGTEHKYNIAFDGSGNIVYIGTSSLNKVYHVKSTDTPGEWINGYYVEGEEYEITVIYDEDGNVTFEGNEADIAKHKEDALQSIENGYSKCENDEELGVLFDAFSDHINGSSVHVNQGQYMAISIKPTFDTEGFDMSTYEYIPSLYDFLDNRNAETVEAIDDELVGWH